MSESVQAPSLNEILESHFPLADNRDLIEAVTTRRQSRFVALILAPGIQLTRSVIAPLVEVLDHLPDGGNLDLFVDRLGEACEETWRIVSLLREHFDRYTAIIPFAASTAATQIALGADELLMGEASSLAPIEDIHIRHMGTDGKGAKVPLTAADVQYYLKFLRERLHVEGPVPPDSPILARILATSDPATVGATEKARQLNRLVTRRCVATHFDAEADAERIEHIVDRICGGYISQAFPVTRRDCELDLGLTVLKPDRDAWSAIWKLHAYYRQMLDLEGDWVWRDRHFSVTYDGFVDTAIERRVLVRLTRVDERGHPLTDKPALVRWVRPETRELKLDEELEL